MTRRTDRLRQDIRLTALHGDTPALHTAVTSYIDQSRREVERLTNPRTRRIINWYLQLPHNQLFCEPTWQWIKRHRRVSLTVACLILTAEVILIAYSQR